MSVNMASAGTVRLCSDDASRLEEAPEGLGGAQTWWGGAGRKPGQARLGPRPVLGYIGPFPRRSGAPTGLLPEFLWRSYNYMHVSVCPFGGVRLCWAHGWVPPPSPPHMLGRAPAGQLWTLKAKAPGPGLGMEQVGG